MFASGVHVIGFCPTHVPFWQTSGVVQRLLSEQVFASFGVNTHPAAGLQVSSVQVLLSLQTAAGNSHSPVPVLQLFAVQALPSSHVWGGPLTQTPAEQVSFNVQALPSLHGAALFVCVHTVFEHASSVQGLPSLQSAFVEQLVGTMFTHHPPVMVPKSVENWSLTYKLHVPFGFPENAESAEPPSVTGAGAGKVSTPPALVGLNVPETICVESGSEAAALSFKTRLTPTMSKPPPTSDMISAF
jgi:hypothetical protein